MRRTFAVVAVAAAAAGVVALPAAAHHKPGHGPTTTTTAPTTTTTSSTTTTTAPPGTHTVPASIPADCSIDVTAELTAWIATVPDNSTAAFTGGCYRIDSTLTVDGRTGLTFDGNGATFRAVLPSDNTERKQWHVLGGTDITFTDMTVEGDNLTDADGAFTVKEFQHLIDFWGTQGAVVDRVTGRHSWGDFVAFQPDYRLPLEQIQPVRNATVSNSTFAGAGRMGVSANYIDGLTVFNNDFDRVQWSVVDIEVESSGWFARNIVIDGNTTRWVRHSFIANSGFNAPTDNVTVVDNVMTEVGQTNQPAIHIDGTPDGLRTRWLIEANTLYGRGAAPLWVDHGGDVTFRGNLVYAWTADMVGATIANSDVGTIDHNVFGSGRAGAYFTAVAELDAASEGWTVCGNTRQGIPNDPVPC